MSQCQFFSSIWVSFFSSHKVIIQKLLTNIYSHGRRSLQKVNYSNDVIFITWIIRMIRRHCTIINSNESYPQFQMNTLTNRKNNLITIKMLYILNFFYSTTSIVEIDIFRLFKVSRKLCEFKKLVQKVSYTFQSAKIQTSRSFNSFERIQ